MTEEDFKKWEEETFGYGYGTGELPILKAIRTFLSNCTEEGHTTYDYGRLEKALGDTVTWLLINAFCKSYIIEYGTSPRFGWLTPKGEELSFLFGKKSDDQLYEILMASD